MTVLPRQSICPMKRKLVSQEVNHDPFLQNLLELAASGELNTEDEVEEAYRNAFGGNLEFAGDFVYKLTLFQATSAS